MKNKRYYVINICYNDCEILDFNDFLSKLQKIKEKYKDKKLELKIQYEHPSDIIIFEINELLSEDEYNKRISDEKKERDRKLFDELKNKYNW